MAELWVVATWECAGCGLEVQTTPHEDQCGKPCREHPNRRLVPPPVYAYVRKPPQPGRAPGRPRKVVEA